MTDKLTITVTKTADGKSEYVQIMSEDYLSVNVVLIAKEIEIQDGRDEVGLMKTKRVKR